MQQNTLLSMFDSDITKSLESVGILRIGSLLRRDRLQLKSLGISPEQIQRIENRLNIDDLMLKEDYSDTFYSKSDILRVLTKEISSTIRDKIDSDELDLLNEVLRQQMADDWLRSWERTRREIPEIRPSDWLSIIRKMLIELVRPELFKEISSREDVKLHILKVLAKSLQEA
jgi:hypothetical protein